MPTQPPSFGSQQYWEARFTSNSNPFEWLEAPTALDSYLVAGLKNSTDANPEILHIGCGTSLLSYHLRAHVVHPGRIHNLDYSEVAITVGKKREKDIYNVEENHKNNEKLDGLNGTPPDVSASLEACTTRNSNQEEEANTSSDVIPPKTPSPKYMRWSAANLLSHSSLLNVCKPSSYSVIVDKSTSDSIACSDDVPVPLPYPVGTVSTVPTSSQPSKSSEPIHPLHILAIHMALLAKPKARWISLSYSEDRYPFIRQTMPPPRKSSSSSTLASRTVGEERSDNESDQNLDNIPQALIDSGHPDPATLWELEAKYEIEVPPPTPPNGNGGNGVAHRPRILHWVYVLQRTDVEVFVRKD